MLNDLKFLFHFQSGRSIRRRPPAAACGQGRPLDRDPTRGFDVGIAAPDFEGDRREAEVGPQVRSEGKRRLETSDEVGVEQYF